jgi:hypothetical protein
VDARLIRFGEIELAGQRYAHDVVIDRGRVTKRRKKASKPFRDRYGHTPLTTAEDLPWSGRRLIVGTGAAGSLPITEDVGAEAARRGVELVALPTEAACRLLADLDADDVSAVLHVTC